MRLFSILRFASLPIAFSALCLVANGDILNVTVNTAPLVGHPTGPFSVVLLFTHEGVIAEPNDSVTLNNVDFGGGNGLGAPVMFGGVSGSLETGIAIRDSAFLSFLSEQFNPGGQLSFTLTLGTNTDPDGPPDRIAFWIFDSTGNPIGTMAPEDDFFFGADLGSPVASIQVFGTDPSRSLMLENPILIDAPSVAKVCATDVTNSVSVVRSDYAFNSDTQRFDQTVTLTNTSGSTIKGPISLVLDGLSDDASLINASGTTTCAAPLGSAYITAPAASLGPGASVTVAVQFSDPSKAAITYTSQVLAGLGTD